jgi:deazaflavin-dependent oxidoreductase (nitroreductase family)
MFDAASGRLHPMTDDFCYLTTRGRSTGRPHEIEIWYAADGATLYLLSGGGDRSDWVRNLRADPAVTVRVGDMTHPATARVIEDAAEDRRARTLVFEKYQPRYAGDLERWREASLPVAVDLEL